MGHSPHKQQGSLLIPIQSQLEPMALKIMVCFLELALARHLIVPSGFFRLTLPARYCYYKHIVCIVECFMIYVLGYHCWGMNGHPFEAIVRKFGARQNTHTTRRVHNVILTTS